MEGIFRKLGDCFWNKYAVANEYTLCKAAFWIVRFRNKVKGSWYEKMEILPSRICCQLMSEQLKAAILSECDLRMASCKRGVSPAC